MTKQETTIFKGIALIMMLMYHLFDLNHDSLYTHIFYVGGTSLTNFLSYGLNPVPIFLIMGGYGLYCVYLKGKGNDNHHVSRIIRLYEHYWIVLALFVPLTLLFFDKTMVSGSADVFWNVTAIDCTWDLQCWFIAPYAILSLSYPFLFRLLDKYGWKICGMVTLLAYGLSSFALSSHGLGLFHKGFLSLFIAVLYQSFSFYLGAVSKKYGLFEKLRHLKVSRWLFGIALIAIFIVRCWIKTMAFDPFYSYALIILLLNIGIPSVLKRFFVFTGKHSMNMWYIHYWIYGVVLGKYIFDLKYPLLVFVAVYLLCLLVSYLVDGIATVIRKV